jgi:acyl-coenzyme A synthetase/AMP-(fatty) acid ligase
MYWNSIQHTRETFINGWFKTKDMVYWDEDGYLVYACRKDDIIRIKESYVNPIDIEEEILQHPAVEECVVVSIKNKFDMPEISSKIVLKNKQDLNAGELRKFLTGKFESYKIPKHIDFVDELPKTVTTKKIRNKDANNV